HEMARILLIHQRVNKHSQNRNHAVLDQAIANEFLEINRELKMVVAMPHLHNDARYKNRERQHHLDQHESAELRSEEDQALDRQGVHDLIELRVSLPPDEFSRIKGN